MLIYTSIYGDYDAPKHTIRHQFVSEWRLYTDNKHIKAPGWNIVIEDRSTIATPRMQAKWRKCHPPNDAATSLYIDGSIAIRKKGVIDEARKLLESTDWAMYRNPERDTVFAEATFSATKPKYKGMRLLEQAQYYSDTFPRYKHSTLWAAGILARRYIHTIIDASHAWYDECLKWTPQDQISLPVILLRYNIEPATMSGDLYENPNFTIDYNGHRSLM